jgi:tetratricopeptide (TPR) repeat protein
MNVSAVSPKTCPRCGRQTATPFGALGGCLRCAGMRAILLDLDEVPAEETASAPGPDARQPEHIGPYEIVDELGRGGMGRVFAARQPRLDRLVALKVLAAGPANAALEQRFLREIQTIARLRHPHIVAIHDSGRADGQVYFAMDYVEDGDLARRLREAPLTPRAAAALVQKVASALAHAHEAGVLHRDLKPSNILLDGDEPRLADFGLAGQLEPGGDLTLASAVLGTPHYLAPEAIHGGSAALGVASDLYALGVVLYEILAQRTPFAGAGAAELPALVQANEPPPLRLLAPATPRDLETICLQCLEREPARRYASAAALAEDLRRFLAGEPIVARPPGAFERFGRFARRHRTLIAVTATTGTALTAGIAVSTALAIRATRAEKRASVETAAANAVVAFLKDDVLAKASLEEQPEPDLKLRTVLDRTSRNIEQRFTGHPEVESPIREMLGVTYTSLGDYELAHHHLARALALARQQYGLDDLKTLAVENELADTLIYLGRSAEAVHAKKRLLEIFRRRVGEDERLTLLTAGDLAVALTQAGNYAEAETLLRDVVLRDRRIFGPGDPATITALNSLGIAINSLGRRSEAAALLTEALTRARKTFGLERELTINCMVNLAGIHGRIGDLSKSLALLEEAVPVSRRVLGPEHPTTLRAMHTLGVAFVSERRLTEAGAILEPVLEARRRVLSPDHLQTLQTESALAACRIEEGRFAEGATLAESVLEKRTRLLSPEHPETLRAMDLLATAYTELKRSDEAIALRTRVLELRQKVLAPGHPDTLVTSRNLAEELLLRGQAAKAEVVLRDSLALHEKNAPGTWQLALVRSRLGAALLRLGRLAEAEPLLQQGYDGLRRDPRLPGMMRKSLGESVDYLVEFHEAAGHPAEAAKWRAARPADPRTPSSPPASKP